MALSCGRHSPRGFRGLRVGHGGPFFWHWGWQWRGAGVLERLEAPRGQRGAREQPDSWCLCSSDMREKVRAQAGHWYFLTSECVCRCARRLERSAKARLQWVQENGFSPGERGT